MNEEGSWVNDCTQALLDGQPLASASAAFADLTVERAYAIQQQVIQRLLSKGNWGGIQGYKTALSAPAAQAAMRVDDAVIGVLFEGGSLQHNTLQADRPVVLETELGFTLACDITAPVSVESVNGLIAQCQGVIELACVHFQGRPNGLDMLATNSATYKHFVAPGVAGWRDLDLDTQVLTLSRGGEPLHQAEAGQVMHGQMQALSWLINTTLAQGYELRAGHLLMTGSVGGVQPGKPGHYLADFSGLGRLDLTLT